MRMTGFYGYRSNLEPFIGLGPTQQARLLSDWGCNCVFGGYEDAAFVEAAHAAGLSVYAELACFVGDHHWTNCPESRPVTADGQYLDAEDGYCGVNPSVPSIRQECLAALRRLASDHVVDGVWLDFVRWPCHWEVHTPRLIDTSFDRGTLDRFCADTGVDCRGLDIPCVARRIKDRFSTAWCAWRCEQITSFVAQARAVLKSARPAALLGMFGVPWCEQDHGGAIRTIIGQDYRRLGRYVDVISPMCYHQMCGQPPEWVQAVTDEICALSQVPVCPILQGVDDEKALDPAGYQRVLEMTMHNPAAEGVLVFHLGGVLKAGRLEMTRRAFKGV